MDQIHINNRFVLEFCKTTAQRKAGATILDFGCGEGDLVRAGLDAGLNISGADVFYETTSERDKNAVGSLLGSAIHEIVDGRIPFPDEHFDLVVSNQVMEHVDDLDAVLKEISRVLKPGGEVLSLFPPGDVWREPHINIPFVQMLPKGSRLRFNYTRALRTIGVGDKQKPPADPAKWADEWLAWIDEYTRYRSRAEIKSTFDRYFTNDHIERENIRYRLDGRAGGEAISAALKAPGMTRLAEALFRKLAFVTIHSRKA